ncbi:hypothetical protein BACCIP111899_04274 [Bacillus rhizoplanae]|uniref:Aspartyl-phosphate phosphatase Spo0E family protein n=1 Tax=Bacillus rhizoplanae TaxID=2880966 RepID=A0ABM8YGV3_9BACI|nr:aspartyl-phosphate phosphatase Spo0E family protein [Bacillus rhizoplanae]CAG9615038.1 hypothetical protein BACCIP111899_04274 [Bacillus rhizoplanae]
MKESCLNKIIEVKKLRLAKLITNYGLNHRKVIHLSQDLDRLIFNVMIIKSHQNKDLKYTYIK